jgi:hypothetical protein
LIALKIVVLFSSTIVYRFHKVRKTMHTKRRISMHWTNKHFNILITDIPIPYVNLSFEYMSYNLASKYEILTNPIHIYSDVLPSNV